MKKRKILPCMCILLSMLLTACGQSSSSYDAAAQMEAPALEGGNSSMGTTSMESEDISDVTEGEESQNSGTDAVTIQKNRKLIRDISISLETENCDELTGSIKTKVLQLDGYIESMLISDQSYYGDKMLKSGNITARIPAEKMDLFLDTILKEANITSHSENVEDVTLQYVDMESHKAVLRAEQERLLAFLEQAETIEDMIALESRLSQLRYEIESMEAQLRTYDNLVNYATVDLSIQEVSRLLPKEEVNPTMGQRISTGFGENLYRALRGLENVLVAIIVTMPFWIIWVAVIGAFIFLVKFIIKRRQKKEEEKIKAITGGVPRVTTEKDTEHESEL